MCIPVLTSVVSPGGSYTQIHNDLHALCIVTAVFTKNEGGKKLFILFKANANNRALMSRRHNSEVALGWEVGINPCPLNS